MDRVLNSRDEKQTIYEIYRACRLCGAGAGYKMPIIQNVVDLDGDGVELRQKIKDCVQIEVNHTDRMPPLICELCVDKVNDFYEFLDMCKRNNKRTRLRLGLPLQTRARDSVDSENCILGVTEPVFQDYDDIPSRRKKTKIKKEPEFKTDDENSTEIVYSSVVGHPLKFKIQRKRIEFKVKTKEDRPSPKPGVSRESSESDYRGGSKSQRNRDPSPPKRITRQKAEQIVPQQIETPKLHQLKSMKVIKKTEDSLLVERKLKRPREEVKVDTPPPSKKTKANPVPLKVSSNSSSKLKKAPNEQKDSPKPQLAKPASKKDPKPSPPSKTTPKPTPSKSLPSKELPSKLTPSKGPLSKATPSKVPPSKPAPSKQTPSKPTPSTESKAFYCNICNMQTKTSQAFGKHNSIHIPSFTSPKNACNACELWFQTVDEAVTHHKNHRNENIPYKCTRCYGYFKLQEAYEEHFASDLCLSVYEVPDVKCWECWRTFPTNKLMEEHKCAGEDGRPGGKCGKCKRSYALLKNLIKHESSCTYKKKGDVKIDPDVKARLLPMQVRVARCDPLLSDGVADSSKVHQRYGLDSKCRYPYFSYIRVKPELKSFKHMVSIDPSVKEEFQRWDSDDDNESQKKVDTLTSISLKSLNKTVGKSVKNESAFDTFTDFDLASKIDNIIDNLGLDDTQTSCSYDSDSIVDKKQEAKVQIVDKNKEKFINTSDSGTSSPTIINSFSLSVIDNENTSKTDVDANNDIAKVEIVQKQNDTVEKQNETSVEKHTPEKTDEKQDEPDEMDCLPERNNEAYEKEANTSKTLEETPDKRKIASTMSSETMDSVENEKDSLKDRDDKISLVDPSDVSITDDKMIGDVHVNDTENYDESKNHKNDQITIENDKELEAPDVTENIVNTKNENLDSNKLNTECLDAEDKLANNHLNSDKMDVSNQNKYETDNSEVNNRSINDIAKLSDDLSKIDAITNKILKEDLVTKDFDDKHTINNSDHQKSDPNSDSISFISVRSENGVDHQDKFNVNDLSDDDKKLMAELDAQIGENDQKIRENDQTSKHDQGNTENDQELTKSGQELIKNNQGIRKLMAELDAQIGENDQKIRENDQTSKHDQGNTENDQELIKSGQELIKND